MSRPTPCMGHLTPCVGQLVPLLAQDGRGRMHSLCVCLHMCAQGGVQRLLADSQATLVADQQRLAQLVAQVNAERGQ